jgi:predicted SAM-dependent methyltransferase
MITTLKKFCKKTDKIVEIGCSEGYLLSKLQQMGYQHLIGIEPGPQSATLEEMGIMVIKDYFTENTFLPKDVDVFFLMHVFEHFNYPFTILDTMIAQLNTGGRIVIEVPDFDGYCHQHLFYYNVPFFVRLSEDKKLKIADLIKENESIRIVFVREDDKNFKEMKITENKGDILEKARKIQSQFRKNTEKIESVLSHNMGKTIYWWGAGSASVILLNQINKTILDRVNLVVVDGDANKAGNLIPGVNIPVNSFDILEGKQIDTLIIASSFFKEIREVMKKNSITSKTVTIIY